MGEVGMSDWHTFPDRHELDRALAMEVLQRLENALEARGAAYLVVSGGSTPAGLFSMLAQSAIDWPRVTIMLADERWVDSNGRTIKGRAKPISALEARFSATKKIPQEIYL